MFFLCYGIFAIAPDTLVFLFCGISALPNEQFFVGGFGVNVCFYNKRWFLCVVVARLVILTTFVV